MKLIRETAPFIRRKPNVERMMLDVIIALIPIAAFALWQFGLSALSVILMALGTTLVVELGSHAIMHWPKGMKRSEIFSKVGFLKVKDTFTINNILGALITGLIFALIMPAGIHLYVVFIGALFGSLFGKMVFGGLGQNIFNPAGVGRIVTTIAFSTAFVYIYPNVTDITTGGTALGSIADNIRDFPNIFVEYPLMELFFGFMAGSMGEISSFFILLGGLYLFIRRSADFRVFATVILGFAAVMAAAAWAADINVLDFTLFHLFTGGILFLAVFMATDPVTSPVTKFGRAVYGLGIGVLTAYIRLFAAHPEGALFALLLMNMLVPLIDSIKVKPNRYTLIQIAILVGSLLIASGLTFVIIN